MMAICKVSTTRSSVGADFSRKKKTERLGKKSKKSWTSRRNWIVKMKRIRSCLCGNVRSCLNRRMPFRLLALRSRSVVSPRNLNLTKVGIRQSTCSQATWSHLAFRTCTGQPGFQTQSSTWKSGRKQMRKEARSKSKKLWSSQPSTTLPAQTTTQKTRMM